MFWEGFDILYSFQTNIFSELSLFQSQNLFFQNVGHDCLYDTAGSEFIISTVFSQKIQFRKKHRVFQRILEYVFSYFS